MALSAADGTVRTETSVRMSLTPLAGSDFVMALSAPVQAQLAGLRACFAAAVLSNPRVEGRIEVQLEATGRRRAQAEVTADDTGDPKVANCMRKALSQADLRSVKSPHAGVMVSLELQNPAARLHEAVANRRDEVVVRTLGDGRVQSHGGTHAGEVRFELNTSAFARPALEQLHRDLSGRLAGLLDCRRKAARRGLKADGAIELSLRFDRGRVARTETVRSEVGDRRAPDCVGTWLSKGAGQAEGPLEVALTVHFTR